jgi:transcriptional regulator with XRE-family HTH domain
MLKKQRKESGLSQQELALKLGVKAGQVAQLEDDRGPRPSFQLLSRVAGVLGLDKSHLFQLAGSGGRSSGARGFSLSPSKPTPVWGTFARNRALLDRYNVKPRELKVLSEVSLMGKVTRSETLLFYPRCDPAVRRHRGITSDSRSETYLRAQAPIVWFNASLQPTSVGWPK